MAMVASIVIIFLLLMLLLIIVVIIFACKPWRFFSSSRPRLPIKDGDIERPLVADDANALCNQSDEFPRDYDLEGGPFRSPRPHVLVHKQRLPASSPNVPQVGQTPKLPPEQFAAIQKRPGLNPVEDILEDTVQRDILDNRSFLTLEVTSGPSRGAHCSVQSTNPSHLPLTIGRVSPSDLLIEDSEVSGKHALINWNLDKLKWEVVDMGSLNGTLLNSRSITHPDTSGRHWGEPFEIADGDIITLGTTSKVVVRISSQAEHQIPFGVGMASDPMALRRGWKKLTMEDVCYYQWPLPGLDQFGLFGICDGHGGDGAAKSASKLFPEIVARILSDSLKRERVLSLHDASNVLREAFSQTEASMNHLYEDLNSKRAIGTSREWDGLFYLEESNLNSEDARKEKRALGCTATLLLVWVDGDENFYAQCANVGDSSCVMNVNGKQINMTKDHKIANSSEKLQIEERGEPLKDGETRLYGMNLARMLGDKFLKQQDSRFSSEPYISQAVHIEKTSRAFAILASDGLWDVISMKKAIQLVLQVRDRYSSLAENSAEKVANFLLSEARTLRTKDNTSVIFLDFDNMAKYSCKSES